MQGRSFAVLAAIVMLATSVPGADATEEPSVALTTETPAVAAEAANCAAPPCGWINPLIAMDFADKERCRNAPDDCMIPPEVGTSMTLEGEFRWYWEVSEEGHYLDDPQTDIEVSFSGTNSNPTWIDFTVEPAGFSITSAELFLPEHYRTEGDAPDSKVWYDYRVPLSVTFTRTGDPTADELQRMSERGGVQPLFVKAKSTESSDRFKAAFGVEEFRFYTDSAEASTGAGDDAAIPGVPLGALVAALAAVAVVATRSAGGRKRL